MGYKTILSVALVAVALFAYSGSTQDGERRAKAVTYDSGQPKSRAYRKKRPLEVTISARRRGGYSYRASDVVNTYGGSPPPYAEIRQTPSGPFDSGFFFDSGIGPRGGNSPYLH